MSLIVHDSADCNFVNADCYTTLPMRSYAARAFTHGDAWSRLFDTLKGAPYHIEHGNPCSIKHLRPDQIRVSPRSTPCCASILRSRLGVVLHMRYLGVLRQSFSPAIRLLVDALRFLRAIWPLSGCAATCLSRPCMVAMEWFQLFSRHSVFQQLGRNFDG